MQGLFTAETQRTRRQRRGLSLLFLCALCASAVKESSTKCPLVLFELAKYLTQVLL